MDVTPQTTSKNTCSHSYSRNESLEKLKEEVDKLKSMLSSTSLVHLDEIICSYDLLILDTQIIFISYWTFRMIDNLTSMASNFITYINCGGNRKIFITWGKLLLVVKIGDLHLHHIEIIINVFHVPLPKAHLVSP